MPSLCRLVGLLACLLGCSTLSEIGPETCDRPESAEPIDYRGGTVQDGVYMSADWYGELLAFPGGAYYRIHHELGEVPRWVEPLLSFERDGLGSGSVAPAAGNQVEIKAIDAETVTLVNGTCTDYYLLLIAGVEGGPPVEP